MVMNMNRIAIGLVLVLLMTGCSTSRYSAYDPTKNENTHNIYSVSMYCKVLKSHGYLPGVSIEQSGKLEMFGGRSPKGKADYPWETNVRLIINGEVSVFYWYTVRKASPQSPWHLTKAWKGDSTGKIVISDLPLPTDEQQQIANGELESMAK